MRVTIQCNLGKGWLVSNKTFKTGVQNIDFFPEEKAEEEKETVLNRI